MLTISDKTSDMSGYAEHVTMTRNVRSNFKSVVKKSHVATDVKIAVMKDKLKC